MDRRTRNPEQTALIMQIGAWTTGTRGGRALSAIQMRTPNAVIHAAIRSGMVQVIPGDGEAMVALTDTGWDFYRGGTRDLYRDGK